MSKKIKPQKITFKSLIRLTIFIVIIYFLISILSQSKPGVSSDVKIGSSSANLSPNFFSDLYQKIPPQKRSQIENLPKIIEQQLNGFPQKQIKEIQKKMVKDVSDKVIQNIDQN